MAEIMRTRSSALIEPEFSDFLIATIGADRNGGYLSVVSALARVGVDPWSEAAKPTTPPVEIVARTLSLSIARLQEIRPERPK